MNTGKRFENNFRLSIPKDVYFYRFRDSASSWGGNNTVRFSPSNICDCMLYDGNNLYLLELKSTKGSSLSFNNIRTNQLEELYNVKKYHNIIAGFIINFSDKDRCFYISIDYAYNYIKNTLIYEEYNRKSIPITFLEQHGLEIEVNKKKVNSTYNISKFLKDIQKEVLV